MVKVSGLRPFVVPGTRDDRLPASDMKEAVEPVSLFKPVVIK
jgi:hypothetical protein